MSTFANEQSCRRQVGNCDNDECAVIVQVEVHPDSPFSQLPDQDEWNYGFSVTCPVCGDGDIDWLEWHEETTFEAERRRATTPSPLSENAGRNDR
jgi:hypothetical protein